MTRIALTNSWEAIVWPLSLYSSLKFPFISPFSLQQALAPHLNSYCQFSGFSWARAFTYFHKNSPKLFTIDWRSREPDRWIKIEIDKNCFFFAPHKKWQLAFWHYWQLSGAVQQGNSKQNFNGLIWIFPNLRANFSTVRKPTCWIFSISISFYLIFFLFSKPFPAIVSALVCLSIIVTHQLAIVEATSIFFLWVSISL